MQYLLLVSNLDVNYCDRVCDSVSISTANSCVSINDNIILTDVIRVDNAVRCACVEENMKGRLLIIPGVIVKPHL